MSRKDYSVVAIVVSCVIFIGSWIFYLNHKQMNATTIRMDVIEELYQRSADRWTATDHANWCKELIRLNPDLRLPAWPEK